MSLGGQLDHPPIAIIRQECQRTDNGSTVSGGLGLPGNRTTADRAANNPLQCQPPARYARTHRHDEPQDES